MIISGCRIQQSGSLLCLLWYRYIRQSRCLSRHLRLSSCGCCNTIQAYLVFLIILLSVTLQEDTAFLWENPPDFPGFPEETGLIWKVGQIQWKVDWLWEDLGRTKGLPRSGLPKGHWWLCLPNTNVHSSVWRFRETRQKIGNCHSFYASTLMYNSCRTKPSASEFPFPQLGYLHHWTSWWSTTALFKIRKKVTASDFTNNHSGFMHCNTVMSNYKLNFYCFNTSSMVNQ